MSVFRKCKHTALGLIIYRLISILVVQSYHVPDEYWQSLEVAHHLVFGYGYLTWEWTSKIRSYIYPFLISVLYKILKVCKLDYDVLLIHLPRVFQAILSGYADYRFYVWTKNKLALFFIITNWYWFYCASRTITNTLETSLTMIALSIYPWKGQCSKYLWIVGFVSAIRPTMIITWTPLCIYHIFTSHSSIIQLAKQYLFVSFCTLCYSIMIDSYCYGELTVTYWEFFRVNVLNSIADHYGKEHLWWYLTTGLPVLVGLPILFFPIAAFNVIRQWRIHSNQTICLITIIWTIGVYSLLPHKEFRFVLPLLPFIIFVCTCGLYPENFRIKNKLKKILLTLLIISNLLPGLYISLIHQRGPLDLMKCLKNEIINNESLETDVMFLMPCHSTPFYSHLHRNISMKFLTCEPNLDKVENYLDEADEFFVEPMLWLKQNYNNSKLPRTLVLYDNLVPRIETFLNHYRLVTKIFHSHFPMRNCGKYIYVYTCTLPQ